MRACAIAQLLQWYILEAAFEEIAARQDQAVLVHESVVRNVLKGRLVRMGLATNSMHHPRSCPRCTSRGFPLISRLMQQSALRNPRCPAVVLVQIRVPKVSKVHQDSQFVFLVTPPSELVPSVIASKTRPAYSQMVSLELPLHRRPAGAMALVGNLRMVDSANSGAERAALCLSRAHLRNL